MQSAGKAMADIFTKSKRREIMQAVRRKNTAPENVVAALLRARRLAFDQHPSHLPGRPDFYLPTASAVIFVNGCFWHGHERCPKGTQGSRSNSAYWRGRIDRNRRRDRSVARKLRAMGYHVYTIWECDLKRLGLPGRLIKLLAKLTNAKGHQEGEDR